MGAGLGYMSELVDYWLNGFDWPATQARLNAFPQHTASIDGLDRHLIHMLRKGPEPGAAAPAARPARFALSLHPGPAAADRSDRLLTDPIRYGGDAAQSFDVVEPSLPGFGLSARPSGLGGMRSLASAERRRV